MATEIERKWRLAKVPASIQRGVRLGTDIIQAYVVISDDGEVRIRFQAGEFFLTFKGSGTLSRPEENYKLESNLGYELLQKKVIGTPITKRRFSWEEGGYTFECDIYQEHLEGLLVLEVEFSSSEDANVFVLPDEFEGAIEVTEDKRYKNKYLSQKGETVRQELNF